MNELLKIAAKGVLRLTDKLATGGIVYNIKDDNGSPSGKVDKNKAVRDFIIYAIIIYSNIDKIKAFIETL
jgi:hypothetical protein